MNKTWTDRADRDLFLSILMVKSVGIVSGAEWSQIGALMRGQGHGFTNEGCRQHFQGMRRKSAKKDTIAKPIDVGSQDPTHDPIMRRPGPGRRKIRKSASADSQAPDNLEHTATSQLPQDQQQVQDHQTNHHQQQQQPMMVNQSMVASRSLSQSLPQSMSESMSQLHHTQHHHHAHQQHAAMLAHVQQQQEQEEEQEQHQQQEHQQSLFQHYQIHDPSLVNITESLPVDLDPAAPDAGIDTTATDHDIDALDVAVSMAPSPPTDPALVVAVGVSVDESPSLQSLPTTHQHSNNNPSSISHAATEPISDIRSQVHSHAHLDTDAAVLQHALGNEDTNNGPPAKRQRIDLDANVGISANGDNHGLDSVDSTEDLMSSHLQDNVVDVVSVVDVDVGVDMGVGVGIESQDPTQHSGLSDDDAAAAAVLALQEASGPETGVEPYESTFEL
ncbi:hypothetical protein Cpir12675_000085 [Ceratocystis pirilliformis]|uniref:Myb-like domain-containing protein n=1 Tax=Ceratocystis pirilliformis TaxID=259994 RepID=A0ABR3ZNB9_9PEZI